MHQSHLLNKKENKAFQNHFIFLSISIAVILLSFAKMEIWAANSPYIGNITVKVTPARVNSTRDLDDKDIGDRKCFTGKKNSAGEQECTLRAFIQEANKIKGKHIIRIFDIPVSDPGYNRDTQIHTIRPKKPLDPIKDPVEIEGCGRNPRGCLPSIELDGSEAGIGTDGLVIKSGDSTVSGLIINNFKGAGIKLLKKGDNAIVGNYIGTDYEGTAAMPNALGGVIVENSSYNRIGGSQEEDLNLISGNSVAGVLIKGKNSKKNLVTGNYIGTNINGECTRDAGGECSGETSVGNFMGILISDAGDNDITDNLISGNKKAGVFIASSPDPGNRLQRNLIGMGLSAQVIPNAGSGIEIRKGGNNTIGGDASTASNIISGNGLHGIALYGSSGNEISGNHIGVEKHGTQVNPNSKNGIYLEDAPKNKIGGTQKGFGNVISGNKEAGIRISGEKASLNEVLGNHIGVGKHGIIILQNEGDGIHIEDAPDNRIGGVQEGSGNTISGNAGAGVKIIGTNARNNKVQGNHIGTAPGENAVFPLPNKGHGIHIEEAGNNHIGGTEENAGNLISGNKGSGVFITGIAAKLNKVEGNYIGTSKDGNLPLGNEENGVHIENAPENVIGGNRKEAGNLISCNDAGILISGAEASGNKVQGNIIGPRKDGKTFLEVGFKRISEDSSRFKTGNDTGIEIYAPDNIIGSENGRNIISGNSYGGILISAIIPEIESKDFDPDFENMQKVAHGNKVYNNYIGVDIDGKQPLPNRTGGIHIISASDNIIGSSKAGTGNVISGNKGPGIFIVNKGSTHNRIAGNRIGTDAEGLSAVPNDIGISLQTSDENFVGVPGGCNYISGNHKQGVLIDSYTDNNLVQGNFIGIDFNGTSKLPNEIGIEVRSSGNIIGGSDHKARNVISGNKDWGIFLHSAGQPKAKGGNVVQGNFIGTDAKGTGNLGNGEDGIRIENSDNMIGPDPEHDLKKRSGEQNTIAYNGGAGVYVLERENRISRNRIFGNADDGINLAHQLHGSRPILTSARTEADSSVRVKGQFFLGDPLRSGDTLLVEFFSSPQCEPTKGEGANYIGEVEVTLRRHPYDFSFKSRRSVPKGHFITGTSYTRRLGTSEFSKCVEVK
jgi:parallel beta-helix repeat protein